MTDHDHPRRLVHTALEDDAILWVRVDNPPVNVLSARTREQLAAVAESAASDDRVRVVVLTGNERCFSAGGDIDELATTTSPDAATALHRHYLHLYDSWRRIPVPTIAAVRGYALGGGLELSLNCDLRYATEDAFFSASGVKMGLVESAHSLGDLLRGTAADEMLFTGGRVSATEAVGSGLVTRVVDDLDQEVRRIAREVAQHPPGALRATKAVLTVTRSAGREVGYARARELWPRLKVSDAHREKVREFVEARRRRAQATSQ